MVNSGFKRLLPIILGVVVLAQAANARAMGLLAAYEAALANDPAYRAALHENEAGQQFKILGRANLLPTISASYSRNTNQADIVSSSRLGDVPERRDYKSLAATIQVRQPLIHLEGMARY